MPSAALAFNFSLTKVSVDEVFVVEAGTEALDGVGGVIVVVTGLAGVGLGVMTGSGVDLGDSTGVAGFANAEGSEIISLLTAFVAVEDPNDVPPSVEEDPNDDVFGAMAPGTVFLASEPKPLPRVEELPKVGVVAGAAFFEEVLVPSAEVEPKAGTADGEAALATVFLAREPKLLPPKEDVEPKAVVVGAEATGLPKDPNPPPTVEEEPNAGVMVLGDLAPGTVFLDKDPKPLPRVEVEPKRPELD